MSYKWHYVTIFLLANALVAIAKGPKRLPDRFPRCYQNDPEVNKCMLKATDTVRPFLMEGVPELGVPSIDPYVIPEISLQQGTQALNFKAILKNVKLYGLSNYKFSDLTLHHNPPQFIASLSVAPIKLDGDFAILGRIILAPIEGKGRFVAEVERCDIHYEDHCELVKKNGVDYLNLLNVTTNIKVSSPKVKLDGLFDGNTELTRTTNKAIEDNVDILFEDLKPVIEEVIAKLLKEIIFDKIANHIPYNEIYPIKP